MGILDVFTTKGKMKKGPALAKAIFWVDIQRQMKELTFPQFLDVVKPVLDYFQEQDENGN